MARMEAMAAMEYQPIEAIVSFGQQDRLNRVRQAVDTVTEAAQLGVGFCTLSKPEAVAAITKEYEAFSQLFLYLGDAIAEARMLLEIIETGEARLAVALATIEAGDREAGPPG